jgi:DNA-binding IclR family transcriptional regulator
VHKNTASRLTATLAWRGFLERVPDGKRFRLGPELGRLGLLTHGWCELVTLARDAMERLDAETGETVNFAVLDGAEAVNVAQVDGSHIVGVGYWTGRRTQLHRTSNDKVLLVFAGAAIGGDHLNRFTQPTITRMPKLRAQLEQVGANGWASTLGELEEGLHAVAVPLFDAAGRCPAERLPEIAKLCQRAARMISARLGGRSKAS